jgi:hypothetical protein
MRNFDTPMPWMVELKNVKTGNVASYDVVAVNEACATADVMGMAWSEGLGEPEDLTVKEIVLDSWHTMVKK